MQRTKVIVTMDIYNEQEITKAIQRHRSPKTALEQLVELQVPSTSPAGTMETVWAFKHNPASAARKLQIETDVAVTKTGTHLARGAEQYEGHAQDMFERTAGKAECLNEVQLSAVSLGDLDDFDSWVSQMMPEEEVVGAIEDVDVGAQQDDGQLLGVAAQATKRAGDDVLAAFVTSPFKASRTMCASLVASQS